MSFSRFSSCRESGRRVSVGADSLAPGGTPRPLRGVGVLADARPARAMGCHVRDRPALGLSISLDSAVSGQPDTARIVHPSPRVRPLPCSGDIPGAPGTARAIGTPRAADPLHDSSPPRTPSTATRRASRPLAIRLGLTVRLDRPPCRPDPSPGRPPRVALSARSARPGRSHDALRFPSLRGNPPVRVGVRPPARLGLWNVPAPGEVGGRVDASESWRPMERTSVPVPGTPLAAWSGPAGGAASLVVYRALPIPDGTARGLAEGLANRLTNLPGIASWAVGPRPGAASKPLGSTPSRPGRGTGSRPPASGRRSPSKGGPWSPRGR